MEYGLQSQVDQNDLNQQHLKYGDIVSLRMSGSQFYLGQNGMSQVELELRNFEHIRNQQAQECLFKIVPLLSSSAMIECLKYDKSKDSKKKDELLLNLQKELTYNQRIDQMHADTYVLYNDAFNLQHIFSKKYLSIRQSPIDPNNFKQNLLELLFKYFNVQMIINYKIVKSLNSKTLNRIINISMTECILNDYIIFFKISLMLDVYIDEQVGFTFQQFYKKRIKKEDIIAYGDKVCITIINMKENVDQRHCMIKKLRGENELFQQVIPSQDIVFSEDTSLISPFEIVYAAKNILLLIYFFQPYMQYIRVVKYYISNPQGEEKQNLRAGSICTLMHIETNSSIYEKQSQEAIEENNIIDEIIQNDRQGIQGEQDEQQSQNNSDNVQQQAQQEYKQSFQYYLTNKLNFQDSSNLWTIEKLNPFEGGSIKFKEPIRFQNIRSREYLRIHINQKQFKLEASLLPDQINKQIQPETFDDFSCVFYLIDEKGLEKTPNTLLNCNYSFCIAHAITGYQLILSNIYIFYIFNMICLLLNSTQDNIQMFYNLYLTNLILQYEKIGIQIGISFDHQVCQYKLNLSSNLMFSQSFKLNRLSEKLSWEILFVESCKQMLEKSMTDLDGILNNGNWLINFSTQEQILSIVHTINSLTRFARSNDIFLDDIFLEREDQENDGRLNIMIVQQIHTTLMILIQSILRNPKNFNKVIIFNQNNIYLYILQKQHQIKALSHQNKETRENQLQNLDKNSIYQSQQKAPASHYGEQESWQKNQSNIDQVTQYQNNQNVSDILISDQNLGLSLIVIINDSYELLSLLIKSDKFPKHLIKSLILNILYMVNKLYSILFIQGVGSCWKCLSILFRKYDLLDHLIQEQDIADDQSKLKDVLVNLNLLQAVTLLYLVRIFYQIQMVFIKKDFQTDQIAKNQIQIYISINI